MKDRFTDDDEHLFIMFNRNEYLLALKFYTFIKGENETSIAHVVARCEKLAKLIEEDSTPSKPELRLV